MGSQIREVWDRNLGSELAIMEKALPRYPVFTVDTEFPGLLLKTPRYATDELRYSDLTHNVDRTHIIQLGVTLSDHRGAVFCTWQFNFEFDLEKDAHSKETIKFLIGHGIDFEKLRVDGIRRSRFTTQFFSIMARKTAPLTWVTFHGLYDFAYILKLLTNNRPMPDTPSSFRESLGYTFEEIVDLKVMAKFCEGIADMEVGLQKLADLLNIKRDGEAHQAGSDSLLTALVFSSMRRRYQVQQHVYIDRLYGISERITRQPTFHVGHYPPQLCQPRPLFVQYYQPCPPPCLILPLHTNFRMGHY